MAKYSYEFKLMIVKEYLENSLGYGLLAKKHGIPSQSP
ncbi:transposase, partial [Virgibacillus dokdonensis]